MGIQFTMLSYGSYEDGYFNALSIDGKQVRCYLHNKERDWPKLIKYVGKLITVRGSIMTEGNFVVIEIIE